MTGDAKEKPKRTKRYSAKVRTGCQTCKIRRVKCDEEHPYCRRCTSTGRKCDGYPIQIKQNHQVVATRSLSLTRTGTSLTRISGTTEESRSLEFYFERAAPRISGLLRNDFWFRLVYQMGYSEPAVRHALIAVGYLFERQGRDHALQHHRFPIYSEDEFLLRQYNRAIGCLVKRIADKSDSSEVSIVTCVLFMCLDSMMQRDSACFVHYKSGLDILLRMRKRKTIGPLSPTQQQTWVNRSDTFKPAIAPKHPSPGLVEETLVPLFTRLTVTAILHGTEGSREHVSFTETTTFQNVPITFTSTEEAWYIMSDLMNQVLKFIYNSTNKKYAQTLTAEDFSLQSQILLCLDRWLQALAKYESATSKTRSQDFLLRSLRIFHRCSWILLCCCFDPLEMEWDNHLVDFQQLVSLADVLVNDSLTSSTTASTELNFTHDMEFVPPLHLVATRCRDPIVRRKAVSLLQKCKRREGLWDSDRSVAVARRIIALEEAGLGGSLTHKYPPAKYRIHEAVSAIDGPSFRTTFFTLPEGLGSVRYSWDETLHM